MLQPGNKITKEEVRTIEQYKAALLSIKSNLNNIAVEDLTNLERRILDMVSLAIGECYMTITIKRYSTGSQWFILNISGNTICNRGLANLDAAIDWVNKHYPEANTKVVDLQKQRDQA